jgi:hypothetical protein
MTEFDFKVNSARSIFFFFRMDVRVEVKVFTTIPTLEVNIRRNSKSIELSCVHIFKSATFDQHKENLFPTGPPHELFNFPAYHKN